MEDDFETFQRAFIVTMLAEMMERENAQTQEAFASVLNRYYGEDQVGARLIEAEIECPDKKHEHMLRIALVCLNVFLPDDEIGKQTHFFVELDGDPVEPMTNPTSWLVPVIKSVTEEAAADMRRSCEKRRKIQRLKRETHPMNTVIKPSKEVH